ncbi:MAG: response regulator [Acidimicrobiales bacterium]
MLVAIDGASGTGKSTFADEVADALGARRRLVVRASIDSFHRPQRDRYRRGKESAAGYYLDSHDLTALQERLLAPFRRGTGTYVTAVFDEPSDCEITAPALAAPPRPPALYIRCVPHLRLGSGKLEQAMAKGRRRVLVVEDDEPTRRLFVTLVETERCEVAEASNGDDALRIAEDFKPDFAFVDLELAGDMDGYEVTRRLRRRSDLGIFIITGADGLANANDAFIAGTDAYFLKPVDPESVALHMQALMSRIDPVGRVLRVGDLVLDDAEHRVAIAGRRVVLTRLEYAILAVLLRSASRVVRTDELLHRVRGAHAVGDEGIRDSLGVHIRNLRRKLGSNGSLIKTVRGVGYVVEPPDA